MTQSARLLTVEGLTTRFGGSKSAVTAVDGIDFHIDRGEIFGLVGESGSGKSATCRSLLRLFGGATARVTGRLDFDGTDLTRLSGRSLEDFRGARIAMVFQDPMTALNPTMRVGDQIAEGLIRHRGMRRPEALAAAEALLVSVGVTSPKERLRVYPHQLSGGLRQRVVIAIALACHPQLLVADEPTTALDVTIQDQILKLLRRLRDETGMSMLMITHDLGVVAQTCDRVAVMYGGRIVETGPAAEVLHRPVHPYTRALLEALPAHAARGEKLKPIGGEPPNLAHPPSGCRFHPRCTSAIAACSVREPELSSVGVERLSACLRQEELA